MSQLRAHRLQVQVKFVALAAAVFLTGCCTCKKYHIREYDQAFTNGVLWGRMVAQDDEFQKYKDDPCFINPRSRECVGQETKR